ncbi:unnamed protein product [Cercospora beticola]|nr:unnamed protein product [Cercospora beticola]
MMPLLLRNWKAALLRLGTPQPLPTALFSRPTPQPRSLKDEILELIQPWRYSNEKPPFTTGELIVMMLVISGIAMRLEDIEIHILSTFDYYNHQAVRTQALSVTTGAARLYFRNRLEPARKGVFCFMQLPAELREKIYKMLLVYPKSGVALARFEQENMDLEEHRLGVPSFEDMEYPNYGTKHDRVAVNGITVGSPTNILTILRVSRQIRSEALPIFYGQNSFHFDSLPLLIRALRVMTEETAQHIQDLRIVVSDCGLDQPETELRELSKSTLKLSPKKLMLIVHYYDFWKYCGGEGYASDWKTSPAPAEMHKLDGRNGLGGLVTLAKSVDHLRIVGDGFLRAWLEEKTVKSEMLQIDEAGGSAATVGTVDSAHRQLAKAAVTENA